MDRRTDRKTDRLTDTRTVRQTDPLLIRDQTYQFYVQSVQNQFIHEAIYPVFTLFSLKIMSDPRPLIILNLHGKCKNRKSKNMGTWQNRLPRCPCFSKCKFFCIFPDLKLSMGTMFFSKILKFNIPPQKNSKMTIFLPTKSRHPWKLLF